MQSFECCIIFNVHTKRYKPLAYCYCYGKCFDQLQSVFSWVQTFRYYIQWNESSPFPLYSIAEKKFTSYNMPRIVTLWNRYLSGFFSEHYNVNLLNLGKPSSSLYILIFCNAYLILRPYKTWFSKHLHWVAFGPYTWGIMK